MASHQEYVIEWTMLDQDFNNWTFQDLQLAAELGRSLLERNNELENELRSQQIIIDDQAQETEFLKKQVAKMKEENINQSKVYEQLENSLYDLEQTNFQLVQKSSLDKLRIMRMCENIDYLERKCEELGGTLDTIRETNKKRYNNGKYNGGGDYLSFAGSSDSCEEENIFNCNFRRRSQSLHDIRDFTPSPYDEYDSNSHSNSPDLKICENEFVNTLEERIEELSRAKKKESEKTAQLESQLRLLLQENANLQQQLSQLTLEKQEEINTLRKQLIDQPFNSSEKNVTNPSNVLYNTNLNKSITSSANNLLIPSEEIPESDHTQGNHSSICKRCSMEINVLNLVNSIEYENDDYSSLEFELARASESLSPESSCLSSIDNQQKNSATTHATMEKQRHPENVNGAYDPGFLDYFFGTNSILKKIHLKRSDDNLLKKNLIWVESSDEDTSITKDVGVENFEKILADKQRPQKSSTTPINTQRRKLQLPNKIPNDVTCESSHFDENSLCDSAEVTVGIKNRSKFWWVVWLFLMVLGVLQIIWQTTRLIFWLILTAILPSSSSPKSPSIKPSSMFPNNGLKSQCSYFSNLKLSNKLPSSAFT